MVTRLVTRDTERTTHRPKVRGDARTARWPQPLVARRRRCWSTRGGHPRTVQESGSTLRWVVHRCLAAVAAQLSRAEFNVLGHGGVDPGGVVGGEEECFAEGARR